jgi:hypothetical protein
MLVKFTQQGKDLYINSEQVAIVSPSTLVNSTNITLVNGLNITVDLSLSETVTLLGYKVAWIAG